MKKLVALLLALTLGLTMAVAADPMKIELKNFKWKPAYEGGAEAGGFSEDDSRLFYYQNGTQTAEVKAEADGEYVVTVEVSCTEANKMKAHFNVLVNEKEAVKEHKCTSEEAKKYEFTVTLKKGENKLGFQFLNDTYKENEYDLNMFIHSVEVKKKDKAK